MFVCVCACSLYVHFGLHCSVTAAVTVTIHFKAVIQYEVGSNRPTSLTQLTLSGVIDTSVLGYVTVQECHCANICFKPMKHTCMSKGAAMRSVAHTCRPQAALDFLIPALSFPNTFQIKPTVFIFHSLTGESHVVSFSHNNGEKCRFSSAMLWIIHFMSCWRTFIRTG